MTTTTEILTFTCSICGEPSRDICVACTKDACRNHRCERCKRCSDCCGCDVPLSATEIETVDPVAQVTEPEPLAAPELQPITALVFEEQEILEPSQAIPELFRPDPVPELEFPGTQPANEEAVQAPETDAVRAREKDLPRAPEEEFPELFRADPKPKTE